MVTDFHLTSVRRQFCFVKSKENHPYKLARLVDCDGDLSKQWYVVWYVWDVQANAMVRKRAWDINAHKTEKERRAAAKKLIEGINTLLKNGEVINAPAKKVTGENKPTEHSGVNDALQFAYKKKLPLWKTNSADNYRSMINIFVDYLADKKITATVGEINRLHIIEFLDDRQKTHKISPTQRNNYLQRLKAVFNALVEYEVISVNPVVGIKRLKETAQKRHAAFSKAQVERIRDALKTQAPDLLLFTQLIYYTFARPNELRLLKVSEIDLDERRIYFTAETAKNSKGAYVRLFKPIADELAPVVKARIKQTYLFERNGKPLPENYFTNLHRKFLKALQIPDRYTLYSWKHSGVVAAYRKTKDIKLIQSQCRHADLKMTDIYLRDLGVLNEKADLEESW